MRGRSLLRALAWLALTGCGGGGGSDSPTGPSGGGANSVTVANDHYTPATLSVAAGGTVTWQWAQGASEHTVTFDDAAPGSPRQSSGTFQRTFGAAGTYTYFCQVHGRAVMSGSITVGTTGSNGGMGGGGSGGGGGGGGDGYP
jgi:plastocyanin